MPSRWWKKKAKRQGRRARPLDRSTDSARDGVGRSLRAPSSVGDSSTLVRSYQESEFRQLRKLPTGLPGIPYCDPDDDWVRSGDTHTGEYSERARYNLSQHANESFLSEPYPKTVPADEETYGNRPPSPIPSGPHWDSYIDEPSHHEHWSHHSGPGTNYSLPNSDNYKTRSGGSSFDVDQRGFRIPDFELRQSGAPSYDPKRYHYAARSDAHAPSHLDKHPSFPGIGSFEDWAKDPAVVEQDKRRRQKQERENSRMADPFEVRMRFSSQLQHLNASVVSAQKAAQYAMKHKDMSEDLHSCIVEQLEKNSMNTRANIMYFIEPFLELAEKERNGNDYIRRMQRDIIRIVDAVCPEDGSGAANVKVVRKVLRGLMSKGFLLEQTVDEIEECLKDRAAASHADMGFSSPVNGEMDVKTKNSGPNGTVASGNVNNARPKPAKLEKRQIEQRIEEDRERHKKMRENMWVTPRDAEARRRKLWDDQSDCGEDDDRLGKEDEDECIDLTGTGTDQALRAREYEEKERKKHHRGRGENGVRRDADGDLRMNGS